MVRSFPKDSHWWGSAWVIKHCKLNKEILKPHFSASFTIQYNIVPSLVFTQEYIPVLACLNMAGHVHFEC